MRRLVRPDRIAIARSIPLVVSLSNHGRSHFDGLSASGSGHAMHRRVGGRTRVVIAAVLVALVCGVAVAAEYKPVTPAAKDKCPVCGMFVAKYPDFLAQVIYKDGAYAVFDGAKDMFKYLLNLQAYAPSRQRLDIGAIYVTDYYSLTPTDGQAAWYVLGSDVYGPMGRELVPFGKESEAKEFLADHKGKRLLRFSDVTRDVLKGLD